MALLVELISLFVIIVSLVSTVMAVFESGKLENFLNRMDTINQNNMQLQVSKWSIELRYAKRSLMSWVVVISWVVGISSRCNSNGKSLLTIVVSLSSPRIFLPCNWYSKIPILTFHIFWNRIGNRSVKWLSAIMEFISIFPTQAQLSDATKHNQMLQNTTEQLQETIDKLNTTCCKGPVNKFNVS